MAKEIEVPQVKAERMYVNKKARPLLEILNPQPSQWHDHESNVSHRNTYQVLEQNECKGQLCLLAVKKMPKKSVHSYSWC